MSSLANGLLHRGQRPVWHLINAKEQVVGRLATQIASIVKGKHKPTWSPNVVCGDYVVVINAKDVLFTGKKEKQKVRGRSGGAAAASEGLLATFPLFLGHLTPWC
jgi:ribosomal protein L13